MGEPDEFKKRMSVTWGLAIWALSMAFSMGFIYSNMIANDRQVEKNAVQAHEFTEQEVGGLRADWERGNQQLIRRDNEIIRRIEELEKYHKE